MRMAALRLRLLLGCAVSCLGTPDVDDHNLYSQHAPLYTLYQTGLDSGSVALERRISRMEGQVRVELGETGSADDPVALPHKRLLQLGMPPTIVANLQRLLEEGAQRSKHARADYTLEALGETKAAASSGNAAATGTTNAAAYQVCVCLTRNIGCTLSSCNVGLAPQSLQTHAHTHLS